MRRDEARSDHGFSTVTGILSFRLQAIDRRGMSLVTPAAANGGVFGRAARVRGPSNFQRPTSNVQRPTSDSQWVMAARRVLCGLFVVGCSPLG
jgi:hypothetical protein